MRAPQSRTSETLTHANGRDRYLDLLRAIAILRVIVFHMFTFAWLSFVFPAMGVMFGLGGSLMAASVMRAPGRAVRSRVRRLLPALWVMGAVLIPLMWWHDQELSVELAFWLVPLAEPFGTEWVEPATTVLWYLVTYLWFVLLSPVAWWAYRRRPLATLLVPLVVLAATQVGPFEVGGLAGDVVVNMATFGACWVAGFAHRTGQLRRLNGVLLAFLVPALLAAGAAWALTHETDEGANLNEIPLAQGLYSLGFVLVALRVAPSMGWLARNRPLDGTVTLLNSRAVTIYLWHNVAIALAFPLGDLIGAWNLGDLGYLGVAVALIALAVLVFGWVEDVAARRRPALLPVGPPRTAGRHAVRT
ncbi:integral membrane transferase [Virgisporangium aliadipatigenens]|uniref:Integral membrane transferase n=1 Tax=Virgisporangium aliadipatigenens TaxID=741659 RepID=A0A8J4DSQ1_9ACTN|nr:acyltransferase [Virgisporangium aliadipatigenens]GIJ48954.1 integral membrane transferase [Virgisporangium aliadipatigenens]